MTHTTKLDDALKTMSQYMYAETSDEMTAKAKSQIKALMIELIGEDESGCPEHINNPSLGCYNYVCLMSLHANSIKSALRKKVEEV